MVYSPPPTSPPSKGHLAVLWELLTFLHVCVLCTYNHTHMQSYTHTYYNHTWQEGTNVSVKVSHAVQTWYTCSAYSENEETYQASTSHAVDIDVYHVVARGWAVGAACDLCISHCLYVAHSCAHFDQHSWCIRPAIANKTCVQWSSQHKQ